MHDMGGFLSLQQQPYQHDTHFFKHRRHRATIDNFVFTHSPRKHITMRFFFPCSILSCVFCVELVLSFRFALLRVFASTLHLLFFPFLFSFVPPLDRELVLPHIVHLMATRSSEPSTVFAYPCCLANKPPTTPLWHSIDTFVFFPTLLLHFKP